jgi:hypothetical protein
MEDGFDIGLDDDPLSLLIKRSCICITRTILSLLRYRAAWARVTDGRKGFCGAFLSC